MALENGKASGPSLLALLDAVAEDAAQLVQCREALSQHELNSEARLLALANLHRTLTSLSIQADRILDLIPDPHEIH